MADSDQSPSAVPGGPGGMAAVLASIRSFDRRNEAAEGLAPATAAEAIPGQANRKKKSGFRLSCRIDRSGKPQLSTPHIIEIPRCCNRSSPDRSKMKIGSGLTSWFHCGHLPASDSKKTHSETS